MNPKTVAIAYLETWNESDHRHRRELLAKHWSRKASYVDPLMSGDGVEGIAAMIEGAREKFSGLVFSLRAEPDGHGPYIRLSWTLGAPTGAPAAHGSDTIILDDDQRIAEVIGFLDAAAA